MVQNLEDLIVALFECISTTTGEDARQGIGDSLHLLGTKQPSLFLSAAHAFLLQQNKLSGKNRAFVLCSISRVLEKQVVADDVEEQQALLIVNLATQEMTMTKESDEEWANSAKDLLVTLAKTSRFTSAVMDALLQKFPPGLSVPPHRYIILAFAAIAEHNAAGFLPFLTDILSRTVPLLGHIKSEPLRCYWSQGIVSFVKAIFEVVANSCPEDSVEADEDEDHDIVSNYTDQMEAIYDTVMVWLASKDSKARADAAECIGRLCLLINGQRLNQDLKKLVTVFLALYRKAFPDEYYTITKAVCAFVEALCIEETRPFEYYFDDLLNALFPHVCTLAEQSLSNEDPNVSSETMKMQTEIFQCFSTVSSRFSDRIVYFLLHKMQNAQDSVKLGAISVMRHLLNFSKSLCECERIILMGLKPLLTDEHNQLSFVVRKGLCQLCVAFADNLYLSRDIGGMNVIAFIISNMVPPSDLAKRVLTDADQTNLSQLNLQCAQALHTIASDCKLESDLLFPYLFEFICMESYNSVVTYIMKSLSAFLERSQEKMDFDVGFDNPRVAGRYQVLTRIFVCMSRAPLNAQLTIRAQEAIRLMKNLWEWFSPDLSKVVQGDLETLKDSLAELGPSGSHHDELKWTRVDKWHSHVLDFLSAVMRAERRGEWRSELAAAMGKQLHIYSQLPHEKAFLMRCLGSMLTGYTKTTFVTDHIILLFKETHHENRIERMGCAMAVGFCAQTHTDLVLTELENVAKWEHTRKSSSGFFSFIKDAMPYKGTPADMVFLRATLMLSFGYVILYCPTDVVIQRLEQNVLIFLRNYLDVYKQEVTVREALLETINLIAKAVHPSSLGVDYKLEARTLLYNFIKENIQAESKEMLTNSIRLLSAKALASLIKLDPEITDTELWDLGNVLTNYIIPIHREKSGLKTSSDIYVTTLPRRRPPSYMESEMRSRSVSYHRRNLSSSAFVRPIDDDESSTMMDATMVQFRNAVEVMIAKRPIVDTVTQLLKMLIPYYGSVADHERLRAVDTTVLVLRVYLDNATDIAIGRAVSFAPMCSILGRLSPRLADSLASVRHAAAHCLHTAFELDRLHKGHTSDDCDSIFEVDEFITRLLLDDGGKLDNIRSRAAVQNIAREIEHRLPQTQAQTYISVLFDMLCDRQSNVSSSAAQLLTAILTDRGSALHNEGEILVSTMLEKMAAVHSCVQTYSDLLNAFIAFLNHQQTIVIDVLLRQPLPYSVSNIDAWQAAAREEQQFPAIADYILELAGVNNSPDASDSEPEYYDVLNTGGGSVVKSVKPETCALVAAMDELIKAGESSDALMERVPYFLTALFQILAAIVDSQYPVVATHKEEGKKSVVITPDLRRMMSTPAVIVSQALKSLLARTRAEQIMDFMNAERGWTHCLNAQQFTIAIRVLVRAFCEHRPRWIEPLCQLMIARISSPQEAQRTAAVAVLSSCIPSCPNAEGRFDCGLLDDTVQALLIAQKDSKLLIRKLAMHGLGEIARISYTSVNDDPSSREVIARYSRVVVDSAMTGLDDTHDRGDQIAIEAVHVLDKMALIAHQDLLKEILPQLLLKIKPCFEKESAELRTLAFSLFAELGGRVGDCDEFRDHLQQNIVSICLHLNDEDLNVQNKCAHVLVQTAALLTAEPARTLINEEIEDNRPARNYIGFLKDFSMIFALSFPDRINNYALNCNNYFKSSSARIRMNAAHMTGFLMAALTPQLRGTLSKELIFSGIVLLLKDNDVDGVRAVLLRRKTPLHRLPCGHSIAADVAWLEITEHATHARINALPIDSIRKNELIAEFRLRERKGEGELFEKTLSLPWGVLVEPTPDTDAAWSILDEEFSDKELNYRTWSTKRRIATYALVQKAKRPVKLDTFTIFSYGEVLDKETLRSTKRLFGRPLESIRFDSSTRSEDILGTPQKMGCVMETVRRAQCTNPVILLKNIDDVTDRKAQKLITRLREPDRLHSFMDRSVGVPFDLSNVLFVEMFHVETRTDSSNLGRKVKAVIRVSTRVDIIETLVLPPLLAKLGWEAHRLLFTRDLLCKVLLYWCLDIGFEWFEYYVEDYLELSTACGRNFARNQEVNDEEVIQVMECSYNYCTEHAERYGIPECNLQNGITLDRGIAKTKGTSAGVATFLSIFSLLTNRRVRRDSATTGVSTLRGHVTRIGGLYLKCYAAHTMVGIRRFVLSSDNKLDVEQELDDRLKSELEFIYVDTVDELIREMMEKEES